MEASTPIMSNSKWSKVFLRMLILSYNNLHSHISMNEKNYVTITYLISELLYTLWIRVIVSSINWLRNNQLKLSQWNEWMTYVVHGVCVRVHARTCVCMCVCVCVCEWVCVNRIQANKILYFRFKLWKLNIMYNIIGKCQIKVVIYQLLYQLDGKHRKVVL